MTSIKSVFLLTAVFFSYSSFAAEQCEKISCDCSNMYVDSWKNICLEQEKVIRENCNSNRENIGFCSVHGPSANRLPLDLSTDDVEDISQNDVKKYTHRLGILYWYINTDFEKTTELLEKEKFQLVSKKLKTLDLNIDNAFKIQFQVATALNKANKKDEAELSWRDFSADTFVYATNFYSQAEKMLNAYEEIIDPQTRDQFHKLSLDLMLMTGKVYEQLGYSYANGQRHKHAARSWKKAADASGLLLVHNMGASQKDVQYLRYQSASRLHRASYHWLLGSGRGSAEQSLAESTKYMDIESAESISVLVEDEQNYKQAQQ